MIFIVKKCDANFSNKSGLSRHQKVCRGFADSNLSEQIQSIQIQLQALATNTINSAKCPPRKEHFYQKLLTSHFKGFRMKLDSGITDISGDDFHAEIKGWSEWKNSIGQLIAYNVDCPKAKLQVYFFGNIEDNCKQTVVNVFNKIQGYQIDIYEIIDYIGRIDIIDLRTKHLNASLVI